MEFEKIKQLMDEMQKSKLSSFSIDFPDGTKISMTKEEKEIKQVINPVPLKEEEKKLNITKEEEKKEGNIIKSPMVGTFYTRPSPTAEPYVEVGKKVRKGDVLCIIEAMKLMNAIESEFDGQIQEVLVKDGEPVEYGKPLFRIV